MNRLFPNYNEYGKGIDGIEFVRIWKKQYKESRNALKEVDDKYKHIANEYSKESFTSLYNDYTKKAIIPLNTTIAYFKAMRDVQ